MSPSAITSRTDLVALADALLTAVRPYASAHHARIALPGTPGGYGDDVDALEGYARTFLLAGFRLAGDPGEDPHGYAEWYARGLIAGADPRSTERWVRPSEHPQAKVEAASLALVLDLTREWIWDRLSPLEQEQVVGYLAEIVGDETYPRNNWLWFRVVVQTFLRSVGGPHRLEDIRSDLERHDEFYERDGWYRDGDERAYDHYAGWAMHVYPTLWSRMRSAGDLAAPRAATDRDRLDRYLRDAVHLVGADGGPLIQGRSLVYRFATAAPYWVGGLAQVPSVPLGQLRAAGLASVDHFVRRGVPNERGLLDLGWFRPWRPLAQRYSGTGSAYWASKGLLGVALPSDHPLWTAPERALPSAEEDSTLAISAPGWAVSVPAADGIVRVANHGTDHDVPGSEAGDSPLYARLGYSSATAPLLDPTAWHAPTDQSVVLVDDQGRRSHRSGMETLTVQAGDGVAIAASRATAHWLTPDAEQMNHGSGWVGEAELAGTITTVSVLHGPWEVRLVHADTLVPEALTLEAGGWALADDAGVHARISGTTVDLSTTARSAQLLGVTGWQTSRLDHRDGASPLGAHAAVGVLTAPAAAGWYALALSLTDLAAAPQLQPPAVGLTATHAHITWAEGTSSTVELPPPPAPSPADPGHDTTPPTPGSIHY